jgi:hypothetical protein
MYLGNRWKRLLDWSLNGAIVISLFAFCFSFPAYGQDTSANLRGTVTDPSGAAIPGAELTLTNEATNYQRKFTAAADGSYNFQNLSSATYTLDVTAQGFKSLHRTGIYLSLNQAAQLNVELQLGAANTTVNVSAGISALNATTATLEGGISPEVLLDMPLTVSGAPRSSISLATLLPGVSAASGNAFDVRINGGLQSGDEALLDGASMQEGFMNQSGMVSLQGDFQMSPDTVSQVKVLALDYGAQYGSTTSGQLIVETRSGSDQFHGAAYEYFRNQLFNAFQYGTPTTVRKPEDEENDYGANIGGPILLPGLHGHSRYKAYGYFNWEGLSVLGGASAATLSIPSLADRAGNFSGYTDVNGKMIQIYDPKTGLPFPNNRIPLTREDPIARAWMAALPTPTNNAETNNYLIPRSGQGSLVSMENVYVWRVDLTAGDHDHMYYTSWWQFSKPNLQSDLPTAVSTAEPANPENSPIQRFNWEHSFTSLMTNHFTVGYLNRNEGYYSLNAGVKLPTVPGVANSTLPTFNFGNGFSGYGSTAGPIGLNKTTRPTWDVNDLFTWVIGSHTLKFGGEWRSIQGNIHAAGGQGGVFTFNADTTANLSVNAVTGDPMAGFFLGAVSSANVQFLNVPNYYPRQLMWAADAGDTWRVNSKLTFDYSLRWDVFTPSWEKYNHLSFLDPLGPNPNTGGANLPGRLAFAGNGYGPASYGRRYPELLFQKAFAPRLGLAYALNEKTVVNAGYGIYFDSAFYPGWNGGMSLDGFNLNDTISDVTQTSGLTTPAMYLSGGFPTPKQTSNINSGFDNGQSPLYRPFDGNKRPYSQQWNLTIQHQLPGNVLVHASYVGTKGTHLPSVNNPINVLNPNSPRIQALGIHLKDTFGPTDTQVDGVPVPYPGWYSQVNSKCGATVAQALLPFPQYCGVEQGLNENHGNSLYSSFQMELERRFQSGLYTMISFTAANLMENSADNVQTTGQGTQGNSGVISPYDIKRVWSVAPDNVPAFFDLTAVYNLPFGLNQRFLNGGGLLNRIVGGWQTSPIFHYSYGMPMWFTSSQCNVVPQFREGCIPGLKPGTRYLLQNPSHYNPAKGRLLNPAGFENASRNFSGASSFGYTGYGQRVSTIYGPSFKNLNIAFIKNTPIAKSLVFQLQANFFNAFNNHYFINPGGFNIGGNFAFNNDVSNSNFGEWNGSVSAPRTIQFAGRLQF